MVNELHLERAPFEYLWYVAEKTQYEALLCIDYDIEVTNTTQGGKRLIDVTILPKGARKRAFLSYGLDEESGPQHTYYKGTFDRMPAIDAQMAQIAAVGTSEQKIRFDQTIALAKFVSLQISSTI